MTKYYNKYPTPTKDRFQESNESQHMSQTSKRMKTGTSSKELTVLLENSISLKRFSYGTAGFRDEHSILSGVLTRVGMLATMRSRCKSGQFVGVMITASHNPECDNGAKIVDTDGGMLSQSWEPYAEDLINAKTSSDALSLMDTMSSSEAIDKDANAVILIGKDTRPHSTALADCARRGGESLGAVVYDLGEVTTPQLHFVVMYLNSLDDACVKDPKVGLDVYFKTLSTGYVSLLESAKLTDKTHSIIIDGSNGIGAHQVKFLVDEINRISPVLEVDIRNKVGDGPVNENCGAEIVQKSQVACACVSADKDEGEMIASFDGDADRIVFHSYLSPDEWSLVDGDKIAALVSTFLITELTACGWKDSWSFGVVQTAYANGSSTAFLRSRGINVVFAKTGVKFLHEKAHDFDCGVYFEANGHGTVLFSPALLDAIFSAYRKIDTSQDRRALAIGRLYVQLDDIKCYKCRDVSRDFVTCRVCRLVVR
jgi:phosphoacetylglucosamine mutase